MLCQQCGKECPDTSRFCRYCGTPLQAETVTLASKPASVKQTAPAVVQESGQAVVEQFLRAGTPQGEQASAQEAAPAEMPEGGCTAAIREPLWKRAWFKSTLLFFLALGLVIWCVVRYIRPDNAAKFDEVRRAFDAGNFSRALELSKELPEPYEDLYGEMLSRRIELDSWSGSGEELFDWLIEFSEELDYYALPDDAYSENAQLLETAAKKLHDFAETRGELENSFAWYPKFCQVQQEFYPQYLSLLIANRDLFASESRDGIVTISCRTMLELDAGMDELYKTTREKLVTLRVDYDLSEDDAEMISNELELLLECMNHYREDGRVSRRYDIAGEEYIYISEEDAKNNYEVMTNLCLYFVGAFHAIDNVDVAFNRIEIGGGAPESYEDYRGPVHRVLSTAYYLFPNNTLTLQEDYVSADELIREWVEQNI